MSSIFALDPGTTQTGWCFLLDGAVADSGVYSNGDMLIALETTSMAQADTLAIEMIASYGMAVGREVFETVRWIGRFQQAWHDPEAVRLVYRREVKLHLCGSVKAKDTNVWQALLDKFGGSTAVGKKAAPGPLYGVKSHARAALAVAITVAEAK